MKRIALIFLALSLAIGFNASAQGKRISASDRDKYLSEMKNVKRDFLTRELSLTPEQQTAFFPIYEEMSAELFRIASETRQLADNLRDNSDATDAEIEAVGRAFFEQKSKEGAVELLYYDKLKEVLSPRQLLMLKKAERKFTQQLVRQHGKSRDKK